MGRCIHLFNWLGVAAVIFLASCSSGVSLKKADTLGDGIETALRPKSKQIRSGAFASVPAVAELCSWSAPSSFARESDTDSKRGCKPADIFSGKANPLVPDLKFPVPTGTLSSSFGYRRGIFHSGLDITASNADDVLACAAGRVVCAGTKKGFRRYGQTVVVDHGRNVFTQYSHLSKILVKAGEVVRKGQTIAAIGSTGRSSSPHLHLEVRVDNRVYDPYVQFSPSQLRGIEIAKNFSGTPVGPVTFRRLSSRP
jgi:murein DD-endopeptidase MepM/ murein hydrolase activator NlpD